MSFLSAMISGLGERAKLLIIVLVLAVSLSGAAYLIGGPEFAAAVLLPLLTLVFTVSRNVWSSDSGQTKVAVASIGAILLFVAGAGLSSEVAQVLLDPLYNRIPALKDFPIPFPLAYPVVVLGSAGILVINYFMRDSSAMNKHESPFEKEFPEPEYKERLTRFCRILEGHLSRIEADGNWSSELFVPLDAEIEVHEQASSSRKKKDLVAALKDEKAARTFLVIGQPGSGKSVAMRKLCRDLLKEVDATGKVPIYINLKEWAGGPWSRETPPTSENFHEFVIQNLRDQGDRFSEDFIDTYFDRMVEDGRIFFIFDSFDEIPAFLESDDEEWLVDRISTVLQKYVAGAHESRGIVATRPYKRPSNNFIPDATLNILPFSEQRVLEAVSKYPSVQESTKRELLSVRRDLLPIVRNPFYCALVVNFLKDNSNQLPDNRAQLFRSFVESRLDQSARRIEDKGLSREEILSYCQQIARFMFESGAYGFESPVTELKEWLDARNDDLEKTIEILVHSKLGRHSNREKTLFTFSHKRFAEYFAVLTLVGSNDEKYLVDIHTDGKWRDVLVLLAELEASEESAVIASYAWNKLAAAHNELVKSGKTFSLTAIHGLRFLRDAYLTRKSCVQNIQGPLGKYIWIELTRSDTILEKKIALECVGLLDEKVISETLSEAFRQNISWLSDTALKSCFYLNRIEANLEKNLVTYLDGIPIFEFIRRFRELTFVLRLSDNFSPLVRFSYVRCADVLLILFLYAAYVVLNPLVAVIYILALTLNLDDSWRKLTSFSVRGVFGLRLEAVLVPLTALGMTNILNFLLKPTGFQILKWDTPNWLIIYNVLLLIPWYQIYYYFRKFRALDEFVLGVRTFVITAINDEALATIVKEHKTVLFEKDMQKSLSPLKGILIWTGAVLFLALLASILPDGYSTYAYVGLGLLLGSIYIGNLFNLVNRTRDHWKIKEFFKSGSFTRKAIAETFFRLRSEPGRLNFVRRLGHLDAAPLGEWPSQLPNCGNDEASIRLAQLEEVWLNLDR